jgi:glucosamine--fructose-6-phosphate aminotransferase (isomerizing)
MSLWSEIHEQAAVLEGLLRAQAGHAAEVAAAITARQPAWALVAARGSSDNAGLYAQYLWGARNRLAVALATPSLFTHYARPPRLAGALVVGISQSGQSPDIVGSYHLARAMGRDTEVPRGLSKVDAYVVRRAFAIRSPPVPASRSFPHVGGFF